MPKVKKYEEMSEEVIQEKEIIEETAEIHDDQSPEVEPKREPTKKKTEKSPAEEGTNGPETKYGIITNSPYVNLRKEASLESDVLEVLTENDKVKIFGKEKDFYRVKVSSRRLGFVQENYIKEE